MIYNATTYRLENASRLIRAPLIVGIVGLGGSLTGLFNHPDQFFRSYLTAYMFWLSLGVGALFLVMLHHLIGAVWSVVIRRIAESMAMALPLLAILFIPLMFGLNHIYKWTDPAIVAQSPALIKKAGYLAPTFFIVRAVVYLAAWTTLATLLYRNSLASDKGHTEALAKRAKMISAPGMILFALTLSFASYDWLMSLNPEWYSTIYGVWYFAASVMATLAMLALIILRMLSRGVLKGVVTVEHRHDLGKLLFAFLILWAYMAFSQYFLIWYANLPDETIWYRMRWIGSWKAISLAIPITHFAIPFLALVSRPAKRSPVVLGIVAVWLLIVHWIDIWWNIAPTFETTGARLHPLDITLTMTIGGFVMWWIMRRLVSQPIIPLNDPKLQESIDLVNTF